MTAVDGSDDSFDKEKFLEISSRWSVTSLRGPGERNFNAVSHNATRATIQSVFRIMAAGRLDVSSM